MEITNLTLAALLIMAVSIRVTHAQGIKTDEKELTKPPPGFNPLEDLILNQDKNGFKTGGSLSRVRRQYSDSESIESGEDDGGTSIVDDDDEVRYRNGVTRIVDLEGLAQYPYPYPIPIFIGGGFGPGFGGGFGGRGFGGRGFGGRGFGGRGFGGRGFGGRGFGGGIGGRGIGGGFGGGRGGGRG